MRFDDFKEILGRRPFRPVRIYITSGETVDVRHPEQLVVSRSAFAFAVGPRKDVIEEIGWYSLIHVVKIIELSALRGRRAGGKRTG